MRDSQKGMHGKQAIVAHTAIVSQLVLPKIFPTSKAVSTWESEVFLEAYFMMSWSASLCTLPGGTVFIPSNIHDPSIFTISAWKVASPPLLLLFTL